MARYKKVIYETCLVGNTNSDTFHHNVNKYLTDWQNHGYEVDIQFAAPQATANAARKGLNVMALCVGDMTKSFVRELEAEKIKYNIIDGRK